MMRAIPAILASLLLLAGQPLCADTVVLSGKPAFRDVKILDVRQGKLFFRGVSGETLEKPLSAIEWVEIDSMPRFAELEKAASEGNWQQALREIAALEREAREPWLVALLRHRRLRIQDDAGRLDEAIDSLLELARADPKTPATIMPRNLGPAGSPANRAALELLRKSKVRGLPPELDEAIDQLRLQLTILEEPENLARDFLPLNKAGGASGEASKDDDDDGGPFLFGGPKRTGAARQIGLPGHCGLLGECERLIQADKASAALQIIERARPYLPADVNAPWRIMAARCGIELRQCAKAADELLAIAAEFEKRDPETNAAALYYTGLAHERLGRPDVAAGIYKELAARDGLPEKIRDDVEAALERLKAGG